MDVRGEIHVPPPFLTLAETIGDWVGPEPVWTFWKSPCPCGNLASDGPTRRQVTIRTEL